MEQKTIEGTWEEVARRACELTGHRVRVTILDDPPAPAVNGGPSGATAIPDDLIDQEFVADCEHEADESVTLEEVRAATSKIKDSMARVIIEEERADRF